MCRLTLGALLAPLLLLAPPLQPAAAGAAPPLSWSTDLHVPGVVDVAGPRSDGRLVVSAGSRLYLFDRSTRALEPFAAGPGGYPGARGDEPYLALSSGDSVASAGCSFPQDELYVLQQTSHEVLRIDAGGRAQTFAQVAGVESLGGITFDSVGRFGHRLLVIGPSHGLTVVVAIDCQGRVEHLTDGAPGMEGGIAVAPAGFGSFGGALIAPDENGGVIRAVRPDGSTGVVARSGLPAGPDIGVEGVGFVSAGFGGGGQAFFADRGTPGNPHPGTDTLLHLDSRSLLSAGVRDGDLLAATEGGALVIAVRCAPACRTFQVAAGPPPAHGEGHLLVVADHPGPAAASLPEARDLGLTARAQAVLVRAAVVVGALLLLGVAVFAFVWWRGRRRRALRRG